MQVVSTGFQTLDGDFAGCICRNGIGASLAIALYVVGVHYCFINKFNYIITIRIGSQLKGCVSQSVCIDILSMELMNFDVVSVNLALVGVGFTSSISAGVVAIFQINGVLCGIIFNSILGDFCGVSHNDFGTGSCTRNFFQVVKGHSQFFACARRLNHFIIGILGHCGTSHGDFHRVCVKSKTMAQSIMEHKLIGIVIRHVRNFGGQIKGDGIADLSRAIVLKGAVLGGLHLFLHGGEGALNGLLCDTTVFRDVHKDSISATAIVTSRTALREHQIVTGSQASESSSALGFIGNIRSLFSGLHGHQRRVSGKSTVIIACPLLCFVSKVGQMKTGGAVELGTVNILGLKLNAGQLLNIAQLFVPAVRNSSVQGYKSGLTVQATGLPEKHCGYSGGYVGSAYGAQIQLDGEEKLPTTDQWSSTDKYAAPVASCNATNLRRVTGRIAVGGYVGLASAGSVAGVNTNASNGLLQGILDHLISAPDYLVKVLQATATTIHAATVSAADNTWGFVVDGAYKDGDAVKYAAYAGGFAGSLEASAVGEKDSDAKRIQVQNLRSVDGGKYAGGFFGLADVAGVAQVSGKDPNGSKAKLLSGLIKLGNTSVLDAFRTYIYDSKVTGVQSGLTVQAHSGSQEATQSETRYTGCAGGFGGGMMDGSVKNSAVSNLANVEGLNYTGGFVGHLGKSGVADIDDVSVLNKLLSGQLGALDLFGSHVENCSVSGFGLGTVIKAQGGQQPIAGGFAGYADLAKISSCSTDLLKKVTSAQIAGGFIGKTDMNYIVNTELQSQLLNFVFAIVNKLLSILYIGDLQKVGVIDINLGWPLTVKVLADGKTLEVSLLGLDISVALNQDLGGGQGDLAIITIGDSVIELPCTENGINKDDIPNVKINLIKGNRTDIDSCTVSGISSGYDVYAGGADDTADGSDNSGYSGGFIGLNHEGQVKYSTMTLCDVVRGTENLVGPFTGVNDLKSVYSFNTIKSIEGNNNHYSIYRAFNEALKNVAKANKDVFGSAEKDTSTGTDYNRYEVLHLDKITEFSDLKDAKMEDAAAATTADLAAYESPAKAVLMLDTANADNPDSTITEPADTADPCKKYVDLTISKIWKDFANIDGKRPDEIKINIYQQEFTPDGTAGNKTLYKAIIMTKDDVESGHASTWRTVLKNAPVLKYQKAADGTVTDTIKAYYVYSFEEETVPGYTLTGSTYDEKTYHATITNTHHPMLPDTGSTGDWLYVVVGVGILLLALSVPRKRKGRREAH